jgi:hypothetical protein
VLPNSEHQRHKRERVLQRLKSAEYAKRFLTVQRSWQSFPPASTPPHCALGPGVDAQKLSDISGDPHCAWRLGRISITA